MKVRSFDPEKERVLQSVLDELNSKDLPFVAEKDDDKLLVRWRWKDADQFGFTSVTREIQEFCYIVEVHDDHTFSGRDKESGTSVKIGAGGKISFEKSGFSGKEVRLHKEIAIGQNRKEEGIGIKSWGFSSKELHTAVKEILEKHGYAMKKFRLFGKR